MRNGIRDRRDYVLTAAVSAATAAAALNFVPPAANAATRTWNGGGGNAMWQTPGNWVGGVAPVANDSLVFDGSTQLANQNDFPNGTVFTGITFAPTAGSFSLSGNTVNLGVQTTGIGITSSGDIVNSSTGQVINLPLVFQAGKHTISTATPLVFSGAITQNKGSTALFAPTGPGAINVNGSGLTNDASGILGGWATIGTNWASVDGSNNIVPYAGYTDVAGGGVIASGANTNVRIPVNGAAITTTPGVTSINSLLFGGPSGAAQTVTVGTGNTLVLGRNGGVFNTSGTGGTLRALTIAGGTLTAGDSTNGGNITLSSSLLPSTGAFLTVSSAITDNAGTGPVSVTVMGGYATLSGVNTHSGGTYILSGRVSQPTAATFGSGPVHIFAGGQINPGGAGAISIPNNLFIAGNGTAENNGLGAVRMFQNTAGQNTLLTGTVTLMDTASVSSNGNADVTRNVGITGKITGPGGLMIGSPTSNANANGSGIVVVGALTGAGTANDYAGDTTINGTGGGAVGSTLRITTADADNIMPHGATGSFAGGPTGNVVLNATTAARKAVFDLNGSQQTINGLSNTATSAADNFVGSAAAGGHLILGDNNATATFSGTVQDGASGGAGTLAVTKIGAGTQTLSGASTYTGGTNVNAGTLQVRRMHPNNAVTIASGAKLTVLDSSPTLPDHPAGDNAFVSRPSSLTITAGGRLDLGNNDLIIDYTDTSPLEQIEDMIASGFNGGEWNGDGIISTTALNDPNFVLAVAENALLLQPFGDGVGDDPLFAGQVVDDTTVLVKFTHRVDLDLDGLITGNDAAVFNAFFNEGQPATWQFGDLDYDGVYSGNDAAIFNGFYNESLASVPEPAALGLAACGLSLVTRSRSRRR